MIGEWKETLLADVSVDIAYGYAESASDEKVGPRFLRITDIQNGVVDWNTVPYCPISESDHRKYRLHPGDIVVARTGNSTGENYLYRGNEDAVYASYLIRFRVNQHVADPVFVWYNMRSLRWRDFINSSKTGSAQAGANAKILGLFPLKLPPLPEQKTIAAVLGALDDKIELNRRMNATLEAMARALFQSWFVNFDPVRAKRDGRQPTGLDPATAALFPDSFQDSELGPIPKGWTAKPLPAAVEVNPRRMLKAGTMAPYLDMKNLPTQGHSAEEVINREFGSGARFQNGDTLLARITPCLENGKTGYVDFLEDGQVGWGSTEYIVFAPKSPLPPQFGYLLARSEPLRSHAIQNMTGTSGRQRVPPECFNSFWIAIPPPEITHRFDALTAPLMARIKANADQSRTLATLRDTLLPKLLSGELRVPQAAALVDSAP